MGACMGFASPTGILQLPWGFVNLMAQAGRKAFEPRSGLVIRLLRIHCSFPARRAPGSLQCLTLTFTPNPYAGNACPPCPRTLLFCHWFFTRFCVTQFFRFLPLLGRLLLACAVAYALGCLNTGYYWVRWRTGEDIRLLGSGNAGARNVGRVLGKRAFAVALLGDLLKGMLAVAVAMGLGLPSWGQGAAGVAAVVGHIWPLQLRGRGGKGAATALGVCLMLSPWTGLGVVVVLLIAYALSRAATFSGGLALLLTPLLAWWLAPSRFIAATIALLVLLLLYTHRENLRAILATQGYRRLRGPR